MVHVWFLIVTLSFGPGQYKAEHLDVLPTLTACETKAYSMQDYAIEFEKEHGAEVELKCLKHTVVTKPEE